MSQLEHITDFARIDGKPSDIHTLSVNPPAFESRWAEAALAAFLFRYTGQEEISFGITGSEKNSPVSKSILLENDVPLAKLAARIADTPPKKEKSQVILRDSGGPPKENGFEVAFCLDDETLTLHYDSNIYRKETMERWAAYFLGILESSTETPDIPIGEIELLDNDQRHLMLETWNAHSPESKKFYSDEPASGYCLHRVFEKQVQRTPDRPAAESHGSVWTYGELDAYANQIAHFLLAREVKPDERIGIYLDRSVEMLAALLGIMKSGGAYVPLDTALPRERLEYMASDSGARLILTSDDLLDEAPLPDGAEAVVLGSSEFQTFLSENPSATDTPKTGVDSSNLIYVIYTSGSTGMPKGVVLGHHSVVNYLWSIVEANELTEDDTWFAYTTTAFDPSVKELFSLLFIGGKVVVGPKGAGADGETLSRLIEESDATKLFATPTTLRILLASGWKGNRNLDILSGGEAISRELANEIAPLCKILYNVYGPTEATIFNTNKILTVSDEPVSIGRVLAGCRMYILDDAGKLCPPQVRGNLFIGGVCLAHGYMNRPELTAEKFVTDPFVAKDGAKMYETGDVAYWTPDGEIVLLGRCDHQVKIRGYRIELGEIEKVLEEHPRVQDSVVLVREDNPGQPRIVAYVIPAGEDMPDEHELRDFMAGPLPAYMIPGWFVEIDEFPLTASRKTDRNALPKPEDTYAEDANEIAIADEDDLEKVIARVWAEILGRRSIRVNDEVYAIGADSLNSVQFQARIGEVLGLRLPIAEIFQSRTPHALAERIRVIRGEADTMIRTFSQNAKEDSRDIAIIGMSGRFPGAGNLEDFWRNLIDEVESIRDLPEEELESWGVPRREYLRPGYVARSGDIEDAYDFDNEFFKLSRSEAEILSPQIRLFLKTTWEALEDAGYPGEPENSRIGVYAGSGYPNYLFAHEEIPDTDRVHMVSANGMDYLATRASYLFGLTGPSMAVQTACSTSLVAINEACEALIAGRCEMAIAGASSFSWPHERGHLHEKGMIYSEDGSNRSFDADASGTIFTQGVGAVLLKPLSSALAEGDHVHAVIRGVAVNNDGNRKNGYASPSIEGQAEVVAQAMSNAGVSPEEISYVEGHATATRIGDPIEVASLTRAWRQYTDRKQFCALGSVKSNIGHADAAAGMAGLFKLVLSLQNGEIPATLHFSEANPELDIANSPFFIADKNTPWKRANEGKPRIGAVSSFGIGGTNAHMIVGEALSVPDSDSLADGSLKMFPFSAVSNKSLDFHLALWPDFLQSSAIPNSADIAHTLQHGRKHFQRRAFALGKSTNDLREVFREEKLIRPPKDCAVQERRPVFLFTGQGSQYLNMARASYENDPVFREAMNQCGDLVDPHLDSPLLETIFAADTANHRERLLRTDLAQPAIFAVSYAQAKRWMAWGIEPEILLGHSIGEYVAATLAGVMSLEDALPLVALRGRLMQSMVPGRMLAVMRSSEEVSTFLQDHSDLDLAASNSPAFSVVSGDESAINRFEAEMVERKIHCKKLHTAKAFHSRSMEPMLEEFRQGFSGVKLSAPKIPYPSNVTGTWITDNEATSPKYYASQIRGAVCFSEGLRTILDHFEDKGERALFLEMGPGNALTTLAGEQTIGSGHHALSTLPSAKEERDSDHSTLEALGHVWATGSRVDWERIFQSTDARRVPLPRYRFDERTFRSPDQNIRGCRKNRDTENSSLLHVPVWKQTHISPEPSHEPKSEGAWLCFGSGWKTRTLESYLLEEKEAVVGVRAGSRFRKKGRNDYSIRPGNREDYGLLVESILSDHGSINGVLHLWSATSIASNDEVDFWQAQGHGTFSLLWLARSLGMQLPGHRIPLTIICTGLMGAENPIPENHSLPATASVIQCEYPDLIVKVLDLPNVREAKNPSVSRMIGNPTHYPLLAWRDSDWWQPVFEPFTESVDRKPLREIRDGGTYIFTGGLGGLALSVAKELAGQADDLDIILINRSALPPREMWDAVMSGPDLRRITEIREIIALGATVHLYQADCSESIELVETMDEILETHGSSIRGIFHTAGVNRDGVIAMKERATVEEVFSSKALAAHHLVGFAEKKLNHLDFLVLFSSVSAELGYYGGSDYAAANAYLDGLATRAARRGVPAIAVNWAIWRSVGMGAGLDRSEAAASGIDDDFSRHSLSPKQGAGAMMKVLADCPSSRIAVFPGDFENRRQESLERRREASLARSERSHHEFRSGPERQESPSETMLALWKACLKNEDLTVDDDYFQKGGDSLAAIGLIAGVEKTFDRTIPMSYLISAPTVTSLLDKMGLSPNEESEPQSSLETAEDLPQHILPIREKPEIGGKPFRLFCVHGADGGVMFYKPFAERLKSDFSIYGIESPMLSNPDEPIPSSIAEMAKQYFQDIRKIQPQGPYHFAGYSYGALVAWEMARLAIEQGESVEGVLVFDMFNPAKVRRYPIGERIGVIWKRSGSNTGGFGRTLKFTHRLVQLAVWMIRHASENVRIGSSISNTELRTHVEARIQHEAQIGSYRPESLSSPTALIKTVDPGDKYDFGELLGWKNLLPEDAQVSEVGGNHLEIFNEPHLSDLTDAADRFLKPIIDKRDAEKTSDPKDRDANIVFDPSFTSPV